MQYFQKNKPLRLQLQCLLQDNHIQSREVILVTITSTIPSTSTIYPHNAVQRICDSIEDLLFDVIQLFLASTKIKCCPHVAKNVKTTTTKMSQAALCFWLNDMTWTTHDHIYGVLFLLSWFWAVYIIYQVTQGLGYCCYIQRQIGFGLSLTWSQATGSLES